MSICCIAAGCDAKGRMGYSLHGFLKTNGSEQLNENKVIGLTVVRVHHCVLSVLRVTVSLHGSPLW